MTREEIRSEVRIKRKKVSGIQVAEMSLRVCEKIVKLPEYIRARRVLCYAAMPDEVQTRGLLWAIRHSGRELFMPVARGGGSMDAVRVTDDTPMKPDVFGIETPVSDDVLPPEELDLALVPGIAFDRSGNRLGFGKGYFDRFLARCRCPAIGLAYELQLVDAIDARPHDVPMDKIVTEAAVYVCPAAENR
ncbi:MAG: 5-formyltetrahydrofolate cyclo-ligase [Clostridia bacterium]|nr:5-formyltetrahydrofolate cyclo-ligase [Clostridia bacterium]MBR4444011.1 5-formyltetrahydrofolate cyclo-ligase [Clostridia bacterium]